MADITVEAVSNVLIAIQRATSIIEKAQVDYYSSYSVLVCY